MKNLSELTDFYYKTLYPTLKRLEADRKKVRYRIFLFGISYTLIYALLIVTLKNILFQSFDAIGFIGIIYIAIGAFIYKMLSKDYIKEFKQKVIHPLIKELDNNLNYDSSSHVPAKIFRQSKLFTSSIDRLNGNDFVKGKIDDVKLQFSDIHAQKRHKSSKGKESWNTVFQGLFIVAEFNKHFKEKTVILPDSAQNMFGDMIGNWLQSNNVSRDKLVKMDSPAFEKEFVVYSTDQIEARYILSHALMERLLNFKKKSSHPVYISFIGDSIHMAIEYNKDLFEPSIFRSLLDYKIAMEYVQTLHLCIGIIDELKLNEKLWSKR
ncbi:MAG: DUF3137 domain-containing protein [Sulfurimonas sp.]|nr:DUF3137 domain-containing protein [Sulfurimonas sp.]